MLSPWSSELRSSQGLCIQWSPWPAPTQWRTGNAIGCALPWCAPQTSLFYYQTYLSPNLWVNKKITQKIKTQSHVMAHIWLRITDCWEDVHLISPQMKHVVLRISSFLCFSLLRSANVSMMTPKMRFNTMMITKKKNRRSYTTRAANRRSWKHTQVLIEAVIEKNWNIIVNMYLCIPLWMACEEHLQLLHHSWDRDSVQWSYTSTENHTLALHHL